MKTLLRLALLCSFGSPYVEAVAAPPEPPEIELQESLNDRGVVVFRLSVTSSAEVSGYNLYHEGSYTSTHSSKLIELKSGPGRYCLVQFVHRLQETLYSRCSDALDPANRKQALITAPEKTDSVTHAESEVEVAKLSDSAPTRIRASIYSATAAEIFWEAPARIQSIDTYEIWRDGILLVVRNALSYYDDELQPDQNYEYQIVAVDALGVRSRPATLAVRAENTTDTGELKMRSVFYSPTVAEIFWDPSELQSLPATYQLRRDGQILATLSGRSYFEPALELGREYLYELVALGFDGEAQHHAAIVVQHEKMDRLIPIADLQVPPPDETPPQQAPEADFSIVVANSEQPLIEGSLLALHVPMTLARYNEHDSKVSLTIEPLSTVAGNAATVVLDRLEHTGNAGRTAFDIQLTLTVSAMPLQAHTRRFRITANDGSREVTSDFSVDVLPTQAPDVYLLAGQSNMVGYSETGLKEEYPGGQDQKIERVLQLNVTSNNLSFYDYPGSFTDAENIAGWPRLIVAEDPLHESLYPGASSRGGTFVGPGLSFAKSALRESGKIVLVPAAWSGSGFCRNELSNELAWSATQTDNPEFGSTALLDRALSRLDLALQQSGGIFRGILWHQGEADSNNRNCAAAYAGNLIALVQRIRTQARADSRGENARYADADIPFIVATMSRGNDPRGIHQYFGATKDQVDAVHRNIAALVPHADFVNTDDLVPPAYPCGTGSCIHFGAAAYREMGRRYFDALMRVWSRL